MMVLYTRIVVSTFSGHLRKTGVQQLINSRCSEVLKCRKCSTLCAVSTKSSAPPVLTNNISISASQNNRHELRCRDLGLRKDPLLPSHLWSRHQDQHTPIGKQKSALLSDVRRIAEKGPAEEHVEEWAKIRNEIHKIRQHLLPPEIARLLYGFAEANYRDEGLLSSFSRGLIRFSDISSFLSGLVSLQRLEHPTTRDLVSTLLDKLEQNFDDFTFTDLRYLLIAFSTVLHQNHSTPDPLDGENSPDASFTISNSIISRVLHLLERRVLETERTVLMGKVPRSRENPRRKRRNEQVVAPPSFLQGMIGLDSRDFLILPFCLSKIGFYHDLLLLKVQERVIPLIASRLRARPIDVFLAIEGFAFWADQCAKGGQLCTPAFRNISGPLPIMKIQRDDVKLATGLGTPAGNFMPPGELESEMRAGEFLQTMTRCKTFATFLMEDMSTDQLVQLGQMMQKRGIQQPEVRRIKCVACMGVGDGNPKSFRKTFNGGPVIFDTPLEMVKKTDIQTPIYYGDFESEIHRSNS